MSAERTPRVWLLFIGLLAFACGLAGMEATFGRLRPAAEAPPLLYSVEVRDDRGSLLADPLVVGDDGARVHLDLAGANANMSLDLDPEPVGEQAICLGYRLSIDDGASHEGRVSLPLGQPAQLRSESHGERLRLRVRVARAGSKAFQDMLRARQKRRPLS